MSEPPGSVVLKYQLDFATMLKDLIERAYRIDGVEAWDLMFRDHGQYHEFTVHLGADYHPDVKIIVKAMPKETPL